MSKLHMQARYNLYYTVYYMDSKYRQVADDDTDGDLDLSIYADNCKITNEEMIQTLGPYLGILPAREREVLELRYGLKGGVACKLREIASVLDVTIERVRQLESRAHRRLRQAAYKKASENMEEDSE